jgi:hypothetical protein
MLQCRKREVKTPPTSSSAPSNVSQLLNFKREGERDFVTGEEDS